MYAVEGGCYVLAAVRAVVGESAHELFCDTPDKGPDAPAAAAATR